MGEIGRNDPCPCGSGKKFKHCHLGQEEELVASMLESLPHGAAEKIAALPEVDYCGCQDMLVQLDLAKLAVASKVGVRFVDLGAYLELGLVAKEAPKDLDQTSAGQMVNPFKTMQADPDNIYLAITPGVTRSTLVHQLAHVLDYLAGSRLNPGLAKPLSLELEAPAELLEHPKEFGDWLQFLANEFGVTLDAEDTIVQYLHENGLLIPGDMVRADDKTILEGMIRRTLEHIRTHRQEIDQRIRNRDGYMADQSPRTE
jgi:hypothetical protein